MKYKISLLIFLIIPLSAIDNEHFYKAARFHGINSKNTKSTIRMTAITNAFVTFGLRVPMFLVISPIGFAPV